MGLLDQMLAGDRRALARLISVVEHGGADAHRAMAQVYPHAGRAWTVGITGPPGAGKSTLVGALAAEWRGRGCRVAIVAVDPSSPYSGGALLGDRVRMHHLGGDPDVFVRSMASRGQAGGLARATRDVVCVLDAAGFDIILIETVGAGQAEVEIVHAAHTTIVVEVPGLGDDVQAIKAGILEIADIFVVNKADRPDAEKVRNHLRQMLHLAAEPAAWPVPVLLTVASEGTHVREVVEAVEAHRGFLDTSGSLEAEERERARREVEQIMHDMLRALISKELSQTRKEEMVERVRTHQLDPYAAARALLGDVLGGVPTT